MPILKARRKGYVSMDREFLLRKDLSLKAKGLLAHMLTVPDNWRFTQRDVLHHRYSSADRNSYEDSLFGRAGDGGHGRT